MSTYMPKSIKRFQICLQQKYILFEFIKYVKLVTRYVNKNGEAAHITGSIKPIGIYVINTLLKNLLHMNEL